MSASKMSASRMFTLLSTLSTLTTASTTISTSVNASYPHTSSPTNLPSDVSVEEETSCFDICYGIDRFQIVDAVNWFCDFVGDHTFKVANDNITGTWNYPATGKPDQWYHYEEGVIDLQIGAIEVDGMIPDECTPVYNVTFETCWENFRYPLDGCDTHTQNGKHGGTFKPIYCIQYLLQPNPKFWPDCQRSSCNKDDSCSPSLSASAFSKREAVTGSTTIATSTALPTPEFETKEIDSDIW